MWQYIQERHPIWYFDATGSVMKKIGRQSMPYLYSIVCHDAFTKSIIPVAEFFTTSHSSLSITNELNFIRDTLITKIVSIKKKPLASVVVTDFSWALINAVINSFNKCSILQYLNWSFDYLVLKKQNLANVMPVILYLCAVHFLRIIIKKAKIQCLNNKNLLKRFIFAFTLLQNSRCFEQLEELFKDLFNVFCQGNKNHFFEESIIKKK
jgi:hypothetical protein